ncbi:MAG: hypothetical protein IT364_14170 [Candidatus Hydrogenedentes bacterium]|nr:hypothetical protein [Candidatus Hydrogenedentota bacterium]
MRLAIALCAGILVCTAARGEEGVFMPWEAFETMYRDRITREIRGEPLVVEVIPQVYAIHEARYRVEATTESAQVQVLISGKVLSGTPAPIPLFGEDAVLTQLEQSSGATIVCSGDTNRIALLPDAVPGEFQLLARLLVRVKDEGDVRAIAFGIPTALQNSLSISLPAESKLLECPGIQDVDGTYCFAASKQFRATFAGKEHMEAVAPIEIDALSRIEVRDSRLYLTMHCVPLRPLTGALDVRVPQDAKLFSSSLQGSTGEPSSEGICTLRLPPGYQDPFTLEFVVENVVDGTPLELTLPAVAGNTGRQDRCIVEDPEDGQIAVAADDLVSRVPVERLGPAFAEQLVSSRYFMTVPAGGVLTLTPTRYQQVSAPSTVLEAIYFFNSFEENGKVLSILVMDVPPETGPRMTLKAIAGAEIWSLKVNGASKKVYTGEDGTWMIPVESTGVSHVELAFLQEGTKLGLQGRLEATLPETGLASQDVRVGIALPARVDLLSLEGPVSPSDGASWQVPAEFVGKPHFFSRAFYRGEAMTLAVSYKEPVANSPHLQGQNP